jgi:hypothetical protein
VIHNTLTLNFNKGTPPNFALRKGGTKEYVATKKIWIDRATVVRSPAEAKDFSSSLCVQTSSEAHPASYPKGTGGKARPRRDADHSPPCSAEVKNELQLFSPLPPCRRHGDSGTALLYLLFFYNCVLLVSARNLHEPPSRADVKKKWSYSSTSPYAFMVWCLIRTRDNYTFPSLLLSWGVWWEDVFRGKLLFIADFTNRRTG